MTVFAHFVRYSRHRETVFILRMFSPEFLFMLMAAVDYISVQHSLTFANIVDYCFILVCITGMPE